MSVDYRDKEAVEKLFADYRNARDNGDNELSYELYHQIHEVNRARANDNRNKVSRQIEQDKERAKEFVIKKALKRKNYNGEYRTLDMVDFANRIATFGKKRNITVDNIWFHYKNSKKNLIRSALEYANYLGVIHKIDENIYRRNKKIASAEITTLKSVSVDSLMSRMKGNQTQKQIRTQEEEEQTPVSTFAYDSDTTRLNMSSSAYESGHGRKKKEEWNDTAALKAGRDRYGLNKKDILEYDLD